MEEREGRRELVASWCQTAAVEQRLNCWSIHCGTLKSERQRESPGHDRSKMEETSVWSQRANTRHKGTSVVREEMTTLLDEPLNNTLSERGERFPRRILAERTNQSSWVSIRWIGSAYRINVGKREENSPTGSTTKDVWSKSNHCWSVDNRWSVGLNAIEREKNQIPRRWSHWWQKMKWSFSYRSFPTATDRRWTKTRLRRME